MSLASFVQFFMFWNRIFFSECFDNVDAYGCAIYQKSPFIPPKDEKKNNDVKTLRKKILFQNIKN